MPDLPTGTVTLFFTDMGWLYWNRCASRCPHHECWAWRADSPLSNDSLAGRAAPANWHLPTGPRRASPQGPTTSQPPLSTELGRTARRLPTAQDPRYSPQQPTYPTYTFHRAREGSSGSHAVAPSARRATNHSYWNGRCGQNAPGPTRSSCWSNSRSSRTTRHKLVTSSRRAEAPSKK